MGNRFPINFSVMKQLLFLSVLIAFVSGRSTYNTLRQYNNCECKPGDFIYETTKLCVCTAYGKWACGPKIFTELETTFEGVYNEVSNEFSYSCYEQQQTDIFMTCDAKASRYKRLTLGAETVLQFFFSRTNCQKVSVLLPISKCPGSEDEAIVSEKDFVPTPKSQPETTKKPETTTEQRLETTETEVVKDSGDSFKPEELDSDDFRCKPNLSFKLACNTCWCSADGKGPKYCTRIACNPKTYKPLTEQNDFLDSTTEPMNHHF